MPLRVSTILVYRRFYSGFFQGLTHGRGSQFSSPAISSYMVAPSMLSRMMSAWPAWRASSLITCRITQRTDQASRSLGNHGMSCGTGTAASRSAVSTSRSDVAFCASKASQQPVQRLVGAHHVLVAELLGDLLERAGVLRRCVRRGGDACHPVALHAGGVFDQAADRQRADRRRGPGLLVGEAVGHREEGALVVGEILAQGTAFVGHGWGEGGHASVPSTLVCHTCRADAKYPTRQGLRGLCVCSPEGARRS